MATSPSTTNYTLGRGCVFFSQDGVVGDAELDLGNTPSFNLNVDLEELEHFSSKTGLQVKDLDKVLRITPGFSFTLDEVNSENVKLILLGNKSEIVQAADDSNTFAFTAVLERYFDVGKRSIGRWELPYDTLLLTFAVGETVTGGTSAATGVVVADIASNLLIIETIVGTFVDDETITGGTSGATALVNSLTGQVFSNTDIVLLDGVTVLTLGTDYSIDQDSGRVFIIGGAITAGLALTAMFANQQSTYQSLEGYENTSIEGFMRFVSDNSIGNDLELLMWRVSVKPDGDFAMIGDELVTMTFDGEMLADAAGHPNNVFMEIIMEEVVV